MHNLLYVKGANLRYVCLLINKIDQFFTCKPSFDALKIYIYRYKLAYINVHEPFYRIDIYKNIQEWKKVKRKCFFQTFGSFDKDRNFELRFSFCRDTYIEKIG